MAFADPQIPVIFNCLGDVKDDSTPIQELLVKQVQSSVFMEDSIRKMADMGVDAIVEIGPGKALSGFVKRPFPAYRSARWRPQRMWRTCPTRWNN